jgi:hypothetical protein
MVDRGLISEFERSLSSQEGPVWFPVAASLWAPKLGYGLSVVLQRRFSQACCLKFSQASIQHHKKFVLHCIVSTRRLGHAHIPPIDTVDTGYTTTKESCIKRPRRRANRPRLPLAQDSPR